MSTLTGTGWLVDEIPGRGETLHVEASRELRSWDNGLVLECDTGVDLTVPAGLPAGFACMVIPSASTDIVSAGGTLLNGATATLTMTSASSLTGAIIGLASAADSYVVTGV